MKNRRGETNEPRESKEMKSGGMFGLHWDLGIISMDFKRDTYYCG